MSRIIPEVVEIQWVDSIIFNNGEWVDLDELVDGLEVNQMLHQTIGYKVAESDVAIAIGGSINTQLDMPVTRVCGGMVIPKSAILNTTVLRLEVTIEDSNSKKK